MGNRDSISVCSSGFRWTPAAAVPVVVQYNFSRIMRTVEAMNRGRMMRVPIFDRETVTKALSIDCVMSCRMESCDSSPLFPSLCTLVVCARTRDSVPTISGSDK